METGAKLAYTMEAAHGWCIGEYAHSVSRARPDTNAAVMPINTGRCICADSPPFNFAVGLALGQPITSDEFAEVECFFRQRGLLPRIDLTPYSHPSLAALLQQRGYVPAEYTTVLSRGLDDDFSDIPLPDDVSIRWARAADCDTWANVVVRCFFVADPGPARRSNLAALFRVPNPLNLIAFVEAEIAAVAGGMIPGELADDGTSHAMPGVAVLYGSAVLPAFRNRGIHCALVRLRLERARDAGCGIAAVSATPGSASERNLIRCGFTPCYEKVTYIAQQ